MYGVHDKVVEMTSPHVGEAASTLPRALPTGCAGRSSRVIGGSGRTCAEQRGENRPAVEVVYRIYRVHRNLPLCYTGSDELVEFTMVTVHYGPFVSAER